MIVCCICNCIFWEQIWNKIKLSWAALKTFICIELNWASLNLNHSSVLNWIELSWKHSSVLNWAETVNHITFQNYLFWYVQMVLHSRVQRWRCVDHHHRTHIQCIFVVGERSKTTNRSQHKTHSSQWRLIIFRTHRWCCVHRIWRGMMIIISSCPTTSEIAPDWQHHNRVTSEFRPFIRITT